MNTDIRYKNILVTGGAGFIGSNLCRKLINDGVSRGHTLFSDTTFVIRENS